MVSVVDVRSTIKYASAREITRMKQFVATLIAVLVGGFLALLGYDYVIVQPREQAASEAAAARIALAGDSHVQASSEPATAMVDLTQARSDAQQVAAEVEASVQRSVAGAREAMDAQAEEIERRALVNDAVSRATMFRVSLVEFYLSNGRWPRDADEAGLPPPEDARGGAVRTVTLGERGAIVVTLDDRFAAGSRIVLRPKPTSAHAVEWDCEYRGDALLKQVLTRCKPG